MLFHISGLRCVYKGLIKRSDPKHVKIIEVPLGLGSKKTKASTCGKCGLGGGCQSAGRLLLGQLTAAFPSHKFQRRGWIRVWTRVPRKRELRHAGESSDQAAKAPGGLLVLLSPSPS